MPPGLLPAGRRSLLLHLPSAADGRLMLSSAAPLDPAVPFEGFQELPPGIYCLQLGAAAAADGSSSGGTGGATSPRKLLARLVRHEWAHESVRQLAAFQRAPELVEPRPEAEVAAAVADSMDAAAGAAAATELAADEQQAFEATADSVVAALRDAVAVRCRCIEQHQQNEQQVGSIAAPAAAPPRPPSQGGGCERARSAAGVLPLLPPAPLLLLFSGGVDSTLLAALAHEALPPGLPIDLASVCFDAGRSPDRQSALDALAELRRLAPGRQWRLIQVKQGPGGSVCWAGGVGRCQALAPQRGQPGQARRRAALHPRAPLPAAAVADHTLPARSPCRCRWTAAWRMWRRRGPACCACWPPLTQ